jgi:hypothetical protein
MMNIDEERVVLLMAAWFAAVLVVVGSILFFGCAGFKVPRTCVEIGTSADAGHDAK